MYLHPLFRQDGFLKWFHGPDCHQVGKGIFLQGIQSVKRQADIFTLFILDCAVV